METDVNNKKKILSLVIGILAILVFAVGASYAYFSVVTENVETTTIRGSLENIGNGVILSGRESNLSISLNYADMKDNNINDYYATSNGISTNPNDKDQLIGVVSTEDDNITYKCNYTLKVSRTKVDNKPDLYDKYNAKDENNNYLYENRDIEDQIVLYVNGESKDFTSLNWNTDLYIDGVINKVDKNTEAPITVGLKMSNKNIDQNYLQDSYLNINFRIDTISCEKN